MQTIGYIIPVQNVNWNGNTGSSSNSSGSAEASDDDFWDDDWENGGTSGHSDFGWGLGGGSGNKNPDSAIAGEYRWDERDRLIESFVGDKNASYVYGEDGQRSNKWTIYEETLYFNRMWTWHDGNANNDQTAKHIYLGSERIVSQMNSWKGQQTYSEEHHKTYYYHSDHLGSAQLITDYKGNEYQRIEYTPYGEEWIDKFQNENYVDMPYKFTGKERDEETGFYYYGARYLDPKYSRWMSTDPALGDYVPQAPINDEAKKHNQNLPGMGGLFNTVNMNLYHYAGNNPIKYTDPDGRDIHITITNKKVGTGYLRTVDSNGNNIMVEVPTYRMTVYDDATKKTVNYEVTRHSVLDADDRNLSNPKDFATYEPKSKSGFYKGMISKKNYGDAIELRNYNKPALRGDLFRSDTGDVNDKTIEIHVGGNYTGQDGKEYNVTSWGCFSLQGEYVNGDGYQKFISDIRNKLDYKENKHIIIEVQKIE